MSFERLDDSDISDQATALEQLYLRVARENLANKTFVLPPKVIEVKDTKTKKLVQQHVCHFCDEHVADGERFCDQGCRDDWEKERQAMIRSGKIR